MCRFTIHFVTISILCFILQIEVVFSKHGPSLPKFKVECNPFSENGKEDKSLPIKHRYYIVHGITGSPKNKWVQDMAKAIERIKGKNIAILYDWSIPGNWYTKLAVKATKAVGEKLAECIIKDYKEGRADLDKITLIGHGGGAHVAGIAGKAVYKSLNKHVGQIIGASPGKFFFNKLKDDAILHKNDAKCVVAIHTDIENFGYDKPFGGLDFYANKGYNQPACVGKRSGCSHDIAREYVTEAFNIVRYEADPAVLQRSATDDNEKKVFIEVINGNCSIGNGEYHFSTNNKPPYL